MLTGLYLGELCFKEQNAAMRIQHRSFSLRTLARKSSNVDNFKTKDFCY